MLGRDTEATETAEESDESDDDQVAAPLPDLGSMLVAAIDSTSHDDGWTSLSAVGSHISRNNPSFDPRNYGFPKLVELARAQEYVDVDQSPDAPVRVRLTSSRPPAKKSSARRSSPAKKSAPEKSGAEGNGSARASGRKTAARKGS